MAALKKAQKMPIAVPPVYGGIRVLGVVEAMGWFFQDSMGKKAIPPTELRAFCESIGVQLYPEEFAQALAISRAYLCCLAENEKGADVKPPYSATKGA